ncbi:hypothetical protein FG379_003020 [Cryptosporidium bovis]|uniref:uncharacterized protein n=1 Tax=Cryptosporidium bovis TaxID=310047 RepID=UPI00351A451B|nr:hypothetical protein FG379_003020 [Cryptosporidium bovis]
MKIFSGIFVCQILLTLSIFCCALDASGTFVESSQNNLLKKIESIIQKYEYNLENYNKEILINRFNSLKDRTEKKSIATGIDTAISLLLDDSTYEFENEIDTILELKNDTSDILSTKIHSILTDFFHSAFNQSGKSETIQNSERILQLNQSTDSNKTSQNILLRKYNDSDLLTPTQNKNIPNYYIRPYYNNGIIMGNIPINAQPPPSNEKGLSGMFSISNPAFRMIISTVLMCLGSTPYGAISILIVVTVYSLIEIVIKYFNNKFKKKNVLNSIKKSSIANTSKKFNSFTNSTEKTSKNVTGTINNSLRNLKSKITISEDTLDLFFNSIESNARENIFIEEKINYFVGNLSDFVSSDYLYSLNKDFNKVKLFDILLNTTINVLGYKKDYLENINSKYNDKSRWEVLDFEDDSLSPVDNLPEWYKKICLLSIISKKEYRLLEEYYSDEIWIPVNYIKKNESSDQFLETNYDIDNEDLTLDRNYYEMDTTGKGPLRMKNNSLDLSSTEQLLNEMRNSINNNKSDYQLYKNSNLEIKWYDRMITYSIQTYKQNGIRGVIIMILDIFSAIFSATPIGYLITTLIRLIAFMTDKLIQLSRRRKNQRLLSRMILEFPDIFSDEHLIMVSEEMRQIGIDCNAIIDSIMSLFKNLNNNLIRYNPYINKVLISKNEKKMLRILQSKSLQHKSSNKSQVSVDDTWTLSENTNIEGLKDQKEVDQVINEEYVDITSEAIKGAKKQESAKSKSVKNSFQDMIGGLKSFLLNIFRIVFGGAGELWELIKGILSRIIDFIKTLWDAIRGEKKRRLLIELIEEMPQNSVVHSDLFNVIINEM